MGKNNSKRYGFTLIELLVVISIIAVLMAIMMPALTKVKRQAMSVVCSTRMKNLGTAWYSYAVDNSGKIIFAGTYPSKDPKTKKARPSWVGCDYTMPQYKGATAWGVTRKDCEYGTLYSYLNDVNIYHCPMDKRYKEAQGYGEVELWRTYSIADPYNGNYCELSSSASSDGKDQQRRVKLLSQVKRPASKFVFVEEEGGKNLNNGTWVINPTAKKWIDPVSTWHARYPKGSTSLAFADGHMEFRKWSKKTVDIMKDCRDRAMNPFTHQLNDGSEDDEDVDFMIKGYDPTK